MEVIKILYFYNTIKRACAEGKELVALTRIVVFNHLRSQMIGRLRSNFLCIGELFDYFNFIELCLLFDQEHMTGRVGVSQEQYTTSVRI